MSKWCCNKFCWKFSFEQDILYLFLNLSNLCLEKFHFVIKKSLHWKYSNIIIIIMQKLIFPKNGTSIIKKIEWVNSPHHYGTFYYSTSKHKIFGFNTFLFLVSHLHMIEIVYIIFTSGASPYKQKKCKIFLYFY